MTENDDSNGKKGQSPEEMSLADLLGVDEPAPAPEPKKEVRRDDEPDSGMVRLASMVASSSPEQARIPSIIPPPAQPGGTPAPARVGSPPTPPPQTVDELRGVIPPYDGLVPVWFFSLG